MHSFPSIIFHMYELVWHAEWDSNCYCFQFSIIALCLVHLKRPCFAHHIHFHPPPISEISPLLAATDICIYISILSSLQSLVWQQRQQQTCLYVISFLLSFRAVATTALFYLAGGSRLVHAKCVVHLICLRFSSLIISILISHPIL